MLGVLGAFLSGGMACQRAENNGKPVQLPVNRFPKAGLKKQEEENRKTGKGAS